MATDLRKTETVAPSAGKHRRPRRERWRAGLRIFGVLCLVGAVGVAGYLAWLLWGTGLETKAAQEDLRAGFERSIGSLSPRDPSADKVRLPGRAIAELVIPRMDLDMIVVEGTGTDELKKGPGHYSEGSFPYVDTAYPWENRGRVGIAGHRTTYGAPFWDLDKVRAGDKIVLKTEYGIFTYEVTKTEVIPSSGSGVVLEQTRKPTLVLTTCNPRFSAEQRLVVFADRVKAAAG
ncbi:MAG TPA: sortase [Actinomycetota bacterium]|nr:sortase [Actinomycetota bacterium]